MDNNIKRIVLFSHNDILGGAGIVTYRLMKALRALGYEADMLVFNKLSNDPHVHPAGTRPGRGFTFLAERGIIYTKNGHNRENLFKVSTGDCGINLRLHPLVKQADALIINWINQGLLSINEIKRLSQMGKRIIWTMHDMWCMTGICHHAYSCDHFHDECGNCPFLGPKASPDDLSHRIWQKKSELPDNIVYVAVSNWVKNRAMESSLLRYKRVVVIHNAFPTEEFTPDSDTPIHMLPLDNFKKVIVMGAANLDDKVKGLPLAIEALNILYDESPETAAGAVAVFFGNTNNEDIFNHLRFPHITCGTITDQDALHHLYSCANVVLSSSLYETLGGTLVEGMSCGAVPVAFGHGGQGDIIDHLKTGYIASYLDSRDMAMGIKWALESKITRESQHNVIKERFAAEKIAKKYIDLLESMPIPPITNK